MSPPEGWYQYSGRDGWVRWWDGERWTDQWAPASASPAIPPPRQIAPTKATRQSGRGLAPAVVIATAVIAVAGVVWFVVNSSDRNDATALGHATSTEADGTSTSGDSMASGDSIAPVGDRLIDTCGETTLLAVPGTDISIEPLSRAQEAEIGAAAVDEVISTSVVADDANTQALLDRLLDDLAPVDSGVAYRVTLLESDEVNAFAVPGGALFFTTAITDLMTEDELSYCVSASLQLSTISGI